MTTDALAEWVADNPGALLDAVKDMDVQIETILAEAIAELSGLDEYRDPDEVRGFASRVLRATELEVFRRLKLPVAATWNLRLYDHDQFTRALLDGLGLSTEAL